MDSDYDMDFDDDIDFDDYVDFDNYYDDDTGSAQDNPAAQPQDPEEVVGQDPQPVEPQALLPPNQPQEPVEFVGQDQAVEPVRPASRFQTDGDKKVPAEMRLINLKQLALADWRGSNALVSVEVVGVRRSWPWSGAAAQAGHVGYYVIRNDFRDLVAHSRFGNSVPYPAKGQQAIREILHEIQPTYVLLYTEKENSRVPKYRVLPGIITLPHAHRSLPTEAFIDLASEPHASGLHVNGYTRVINTIAGINGPGVEHIYLLHPRQTFKTSDMTTYEDDDVSRRWVTRRKYALRTRSPTYPGEPDVSLVGKAKEVLGMYVDDPGAPPAAFPQEMRTQHHLNPSTMRVVQSNAGGQEFAEIWRQSRHGELKVDRLFEQKFMTQHDQEWWNLSNIAMRILRLSRQPAPSKLYGTLPRLESISVMTVSEKLNVSIEFPRWCFAT